jgi:hypothetical protein
LQKLESEQARLYERLEHAEETGDARTANTTMQQIVACEKAIDKFHLTPVTAEAPVPAPQAELVADSVSAFNKETKMTESNVVTLDQIGVVDVPAVTAESIGSAPYASPFGGHAVQVDETAGKIAVDGFLVAFPAKNAQGADSDILILRSPVSELNAARRVHIQTRPDVKTAARGLALALADAVQPDGTVANGVGQRYLVTGGLCTQLSSQEVTNFDGSKSTIDSQKPCMGRSAQNPADAPERCKHMWAIEFANGAFVTVSRKIFFKTVAAEISKNIGDDQSREYATSVFKGWRAASDLRHVTRVAYAQARNDAENRGELAGNGLMAPATQVLEERINGQTVRELVLATRGRWFRLAFNLPLKDADGNVMVVEQRTKVVKNVTELALTMAPAYKVARDNGAALTFVGVELA